MQLRVDHNVYRQSTIEKNYSVEKSGQQISNGSQKLKSETYAVVKREIKSFWNNFEIISVFYITRNRVWNWNKITSATEWVLELFQRQ